ncbi:hypothetical protein R9C00_15585 [Flammeovirgaceae bacterium SG7u.111]|nr:hypothetical protein [Flammeovirgaceae bacterium SG7u.132]WPO33124.1 hypothetical protein R9C00_15585 [Flammeovirgaceae bacterium SG7u.111]
MKQKRISFLNSIVLLLGAACMLAFQLQKQPKLRQETSHSDTELLKQAAFEVLQAKCNICHIKKNPRKVFSKENMSDLAPKIYKQVFVKKRMPKGRKIQLTTEEYAALEKWLDVQLE